MRKRRGFHLWKNIKKAIGKVGTLNLVLILMFAFFIWFNWQMLCIFREYAAIPETYACAVIAATIGEAGICGWIRTTKDRKREHDWERADRKEDNNSEMSLEVFLLGLLIVSTLTGLFTEAIKKWLDERGKKYYPNALAGYVAIGLSIAVGIAYIILVGAALNAQTAVYLIALILLSWLCAMVGQGNAGNRTV